MGVDAEAVACLFMWLFCLFFLWVGVRGLVHVGMIFSIKSYTPGITRAHTQTNRHAHRPKYMYIYIHTKSYRRPGARRGAGSAR